jgi:Flp pilus assembly pilin Flp
MMAGRNQMPRTSLQHIMDFARKLGTADGQSLSEYGIVVAVIAIVVIGVALLLGGNIATALFNAGAI